MKRRIAGIEFNVLSLEEEHARTIGCVHEWEPITKEVVVNPAMEYVEGYGRRFVSVKVATGKVCRRCGQIIVESDATQTSLGDLQRMIQYRSHRRTICQLLREIRGQVEDPAPVDQCLMMAKRMNDKLVEQCGRDFEPGWYNEKGEFIG